MMKYDEYGQVSVTSKELCNLLYSNPELDISRFQLEDPESFNNSAESLYYQTSKLNKYKKLDIAIDEFDQQNQKNWRMPDEYKNMDIAEWLLNQCKHDHELQRVGEELLLYQERDLFDLLRYLKYMVDTMRKNNIVWGVGRGSSVASYVLFLIGVHKIDSLYYNLSVDEFLK